MYKTLNSKAAIQLAELALLSDDLNESLVAFRLTLQNLTVGLSKDIEKRTMLFALIRSAVILWIRCFDHPEQGDLSFAAVYGDVDGAEKIFKEAKDIRDTYAAHRFGPARYTTTVVEIRNGQVSGLGRSLMKFACPLPTEIHEIARLIEIAIAHVEARTPPLRDIIGDELRALSSAELNALPDHSFIAPEKDQLRTSRKKYRDSRNRTSPGRR